MQRVVLNEVDPASLEDAVGTARYAMGVQYLRQRAVVHTWWDSSESVLHGMVRERTGEFYRTSAHFSPADGLPLEFEQGHCSCPAGFNCEHAVALILAAADTDTVRAVSRPSPRSAAWEQSLESLLGSQPTVAASRPSGTALAIELTLSGDARPAQARGQLADGPSLKLLARLVQPGKNGGWVAGSLSWAKLDSLHYYGGHPAAQVRWLREMYAPRSVAFHVTVFHLVLGAFALLGALLLGGRLGPSLDAPGMARFLPGLVVSGLLDRVAYVPERILVRDLRFRSVSLGRTLGELSFSVVCVGFAALGFGGAAIVLGNVVRSIVRTACFVLAVNFRDWAEPSRLSLRQTRELLAFGIPMSLGALCAFASRRWDNLLVSRFFGPGPTGMYNLAYNLADVPAIQVGEQIGDVLMPSFARLDAARRPDALVRSVTLLAFVVFPLAIGLGAVAPTLVAAIFDARWRPMAPMLVLLSSLSVARPVGWTIESYFQALEMPRLILLLEAFKVVALLVFIVTFGRAGPLYTCAAVGVAFGAHALLSLWLAHVVDAVPVGAAFRGMGSALVACIPMTAAVLVARHGLTAIGGVAPVAALVVEVLAGAVGYGIGAFLVARSLAEDLVARVVDALRSHA